MVELGRFELPSKMADRKVFYMLSFRLDLVIGLPGNPLSFDQPC